MTPPGGVLSEDEARRLWARAAELQAEAAASGEAARAGGEEPTDVVPAGGFAVEHVRQAALEAGIGEEHVRRALADVLAERALPAPGPSALHRLSRALLGGAPVTVGGSRTVRAPVSRVLAAMESLLPRDPYGLALEERLDAGGEGGVFLFDVPGAALAPASRTGTALPAQWTDFRQVAVSVAGSGDGSPTQVSAHAPVAWAWTRNAAFASVFAVLGGVIGAAVGAAAGGLAAALATAAGLGPAAAGALAGFVTVAGAGGGTWGGLAGLRALYRRSLARGRRQLEAMLAAVATDAEGGWRLGGAGTPEGGGEA